jgi:hypothetical protein
MRSMKPRHASRLTPAREAWIDDVIIDDEPIGCP